MMVVITRMFTNKSKNMRFAICRMFIRGANIAMWKPFAKTGLRGLHLHAA